MSNRVFLGFDFGLKRIGVAVGQDVTITASPLITLKAENGKPNWGEVEKLVAKWNPTVLVVGVPVNMDGSDMSVTKAARRFIQQLRARFKLQVCGADERLTTKSAREEVFRTGGYKALKKNDIDAVAAKIILEAWMHESCG